MAGQLIKAAGLIVYRITHSQIQYLLLQHAPSEWGPGLHWTPPKGHVEEEEDTLSAAIRETEEEAGIGWSQLQLISGYQYTVCYDVNDQAKEVEYWLARVKDPEVKVLLSEEHQAYGWFNLDAAVTQCEYTNMNEVFMSADKFIKGLK